MRRTTAALALLVLCLCSAPAALGGASAPGPCGAGAYSYAGIQAATTADGIAAVLASTAVPAVSDGHVGGWIGVGGAGDGPNGSAEWLQVGLAAFAGSRTMQMYYEVASPGLAPRYVELAASVPQGQKHRLAVLEMAERPNWWRVWVDDKPVSPPVHLPGSNDAWYPQAIAENWNGAAGACNAYAYRFADVNFTAGRNRWRPMQVGYEFQDPGYEVVPISSAPRTFVATSLNY